MLIIKNVTVQYKSFKHYKITLLFILVVVFIIYLGHRFGSPFDVADLFRAEYFEGVVMDNREIKSCYWNDIKGSELNHTYNYCDFFGNFYVKTSKQIESIHVYSLDQGRALGTPRMCAGLLIGFPNEQIRPGDVIRMFSKKENAEMYTLYDF